MVIVHSPTVHRARDFYICYFDRLPHEEPSKQLHGRYSSRRLYSRSDLFTVAPFSAHMLWLHPLQVVWECICWYYSVSRVLQTATHR